MIRVVMAGATGKTGRAVARALAAQEDIQLVGGVGSRSAGTPLSSFVPGVPDDVVIQGDLAALIAEVRPDVLVDFTAPEVGGRHALQATEAGVSPVVGTSGIPAVELERLERLCSEQGLGAAVIPNFSLGALLLFRFARQAADLMKRVEIIEAFADAKKDKPSGTGKALQEMLKGAVEDEVPIHAVRLPGFAAQVSAVFGGPGETLGIRHNGLGGEAYAAGVLLAVRKVRSLKGVVRSLEELMNA